MVIELAVENIDVLSMNPTDIAIAVRPPATALPGAGGPVLAPPPLPAYSVQ